MTFRSSAPHAGQNCSTTPFGFLRARYLNAVRAFMPQLQPGTPAPPTFMLGNDALSSAQCRSSNPGRLRFPFLPPVADLGRRLLFLFLTFIPNLPLLFFLSESLASDNLDVRFSLVRLGPLHPQNQGHAVR